MTNNSWLAAWLLAGLTGSAGWLIGTQQSPVLGGEDTAQSAAKVAVPGQAPSQDSKRPSAKDAEPKPGPYAEDPLTPAAEKGYQGSGAYRWLNVGLQATAREHERHGARPTIGSRNLAICVTAMYDAWAAYDAKAVGTRLGDKLRRPLKERTTANKDRAIA